ncbi:PREDICTED: PRUPE_3G196300 [Prunus dulcis]|uniref:PREDICTED: PRUPE_3G196300 n=1 Tax=Prunus dulcis TaxID=3755 RepID=A0A5E4GAB8_PRUDU|nr:hypothetical protein L3X38_042035 [Prunus dulcis]VVA36835.1 PREDICTED: PRUPE_3G196300 [Prunus dulcis]
MDEVLNRFATKFALSEEEEEIELDLGGSLFDGVASDLYSLVGKLLTENVNKTAFIGTMKKIWRLKDDNDGLCNPATVPLTTQDFWVQVHDLHVLYMNLVVGELIEKNCGVHATLREAEPRPYGSWLRAELEGPNLQGWRRRTFSRKTPLLNETHGKAKLPPRVAETGVDEKEAVEVNGTCNS